MGGLVSVMVWWTRGDGGRACLPLRNHVLGLVGALVF